MQAVSEDQSQLLQIRARAERERRRRLASLPPLWTPNPDDSDGRPNPQRLAYESQADILGYGGAAGSGKSSLLLGLAATQHRRSAIFRRVFPNLHGLIEESRALLSGVGTYNETLHRWVLPGGRMIEFESAQYEKDKEKQRGRPRDFYGFDEATEFSRTQVLFISAWLRSVDPNQRTRIVLTFNPPTDSNSGWVVPFFMPWLSFLFPEAIRHPEPAKPGELRWYATLDGAEVECENGEHFVHKGETIRPLSRTFIPARLTDNPYLRDSNYAATLQALPEPLRSQLLFGDFAAHAGVNPFQVIPTAWVQAAQDRWANHPEVDSRLVPDCIGVDVARGGRDRTVFVPRWGQFVGSPVIYPGSVTTDGPSVAALLYQQFPDALVVNVDVIGVGSSAFDSTKPLYRRVEPVAVSTGSTYTDRSGKLRMSNLRAELLWRLRDELDPSTNPSLALPPGVEVLADLCAPRYKMQTGGRVLVESKEEINARLSRSPDVGDAILLSLYEPPSMGSWSDLLDVTFDEVSLPWV